MNTINTSLAYVVSDGYSSLTHLQGVLTVSQFFKSVFDGSLPLNFTWMLGQGITNIEENLLNLCKVYRPDISFCNIDEMNLTELTAAESSKNIFLKLTQFIMNIVQCLRFSR